jgi:hypothetical protein
MGSKTNLKRLALGAEVGSPVAYRDALERRVAYRAVLPPAVGHLELEVGGAYLTVGAEVGTDAGPFSADSGV